MLYRKLIYENSAGETLLFNDDPDAFLFELSGMGYQYENTIEATDYDSYTAHTSTKLKQEAIRGVYTISGDDIETVYAKKRSIERILNYDQLLNRIQKKKVFGKLYYKTEKGINLYTRAIVSKFTFGEINEDNELQIAVEFEMLLKNWITVVPKRLTIVEGDTHGHPYGHPYGHLAESVQGDTATMMEIKGNDVAYITLRAIGKIVNPTVSFRSISGQQHTIKYLGTVEANEVLELDTINVSVTKNGVNAIADFDIETADIPFIALIPGIYSVKMQAQEIEDGEVTLEIYEGYVSG